MGGGGPTLVCYPLSLPFSLCTYAAVTEKGVPAAPGLPAFEARLRGHGRRHRLSVHAMSCSGSNGGGGERCVSGSVRCVFGACVCAVGWRDWPTRLQNGVQESR